MTDVCTLVKSNDAVGFDSFTGGAIREGSVSVEAGNGRVFPRSMKRLPAGDNPPAIICIAAGSPVAIYDFVGMDALIEARQSLEHHAHLCPQAGQCFR